MIKLLRFSGKRVLQPEKLFFQILKELQRGHLSGGGNDVIGGLAAVHMVIGVYDGVIAFLSSAEFNGAIGDYLIGVHVDGGSCPSLDRIYNKILSVLPFQNFVAGFYNGVRTFPVEKVHLTVGDGRRFFDTGKAVYDFRMHCQTGDGKVFGCAKRLDAIVDVPGNLFFPDGIFFFSVICRIVHVFSPS